MTTYECRYLTATLATVVAVTAVSLLRLTM